MQKYETKNKKVVNKTPVNYNRYFPYIIILLCILCYANTVSNGFCIDDTYVLNGMPKPGESIWSVFNKSFAIGGYRPMLLFSFALEQLIFGSIVPQISHIINLVLYTVLGLSIYRLLKKIPTEHTTVFAFLVTLIFVAHPSHTEVVASLKNRDGILSLLFGVLSFDCFISASGKKQEFYYYAGGTVLFVLAMFSKIDITGLIFIIPFTLFYLYKIPFKKTAIIFISLLLFSMFVSIFSNAVKGDAIAGTSFTENPILSNNTFLFKISQVFQTLAIYWKFMLLPKDYFFYFGYNVFQLHTITAFITLLFFSIHIFFLGLFIYFYKKEKMISYGIFFFYSALVYCSNLIAVAGIVAVRYSFIASLGFSIFLISVLLYFFNWLDKKYILKTHLSISFLQGKNLTQILTLILVVVLLLIYLPITIARNKDWKSLYTLIDADMPGLTKSFQANRIAATHLFYYAVTQEKDQKNKEALFKKGLQYSLNAQKIYPNDNYVNEMTGEAYFNLRNFSAAKRSFATNVAISDTSIVSWEFLGDIYFEQEKRFDSASICYRKCITLKPTYETPYFKYLNAMYNDGKKQEIYTYFKNQMDHDQNGYIPSQCLGYYYLFERDTLTGMRLIKHSFEKGYKSVNLSMYVQETLYRFKDTTNAREMDKFISE